VVKGAANLNERIVASSAYDVDTCGSTTPTTMSMHE
jgi:hypothetical protein